MLPLLSDWKAEFHRRRQAFGDRLGQGTAILRSAPHAVMHNDVEYAYRQDSDFYYLTGCDEPETVAVFAPWHEEHQFILFMRPKDRLAETWSGRRVGVEAAQEVFGADVTYSIEDIADELPQYLNKADHLVYRFGRDRDFDTEVLKLWQQLLRQYPKTGQGPVAIADPITTLHALRNCKSPLEIAAMQRAADIAAEAHQRAQAIAAPGRWEYEIQAEMDAIFRKHGGWGPAYPSIIASGDNACILHYVENNRQMQDGDLLLIDAGCSYGYYNSDITRTFPVGGRFKPEQRILYELVLKAQAAAIAQVFPGNPYSAIHDTAVRVLVEGLVDLGLLVGDVDTIIEHELYKPFYMHRTGHWLGLDVHDVGIYKEGEEETLLKPGQVLTVEPGLYIAADLEPCQPGDEDDWPAQPEVAARWHNIGIRIEDDVLVTEGGHQVLTAAVPKDPDALEH